MRGILSCFAVIGLTGCAMTQPLAPKLTVPPKPLLQKSIYQISYTAELESARIKSVQLPAHTVKKQDTVFIDATKVTLTEQLRSALVKMLNKKGLQVDMQQNTDYRLVIQQMDLSFDRDKVYVLNKPSTDHPYIAKISQTIPSKQCSNITASLSMRLTHNDSADVVWFAKSSVDSAGFQGIPLQYSFTETQKVVNEQEVVSFIEQQNLEEARQQRHGSPVEIPSYIVQPDITPLIKVAGACSKDEVSELTPKMMLTLTRNLIDKLNVQ
ncbi:hypothetical protein L1286_02080 [Pseudoalteromonas sp. SMS1]|uniref:hypothetical protein n=1 Tax=Pseudoalteromonas sp. SMS1 TaxID=2908894 RepID=UPI001F3CA343|nr:hypothetical protein [Pseudoalteromonas sp. SMS1]MCF2856242.1 hypothetical protein [Pseudoalteromonas sp. SMS1]